MWRLAKASGRRLAFVLGGEGQVGPEAYEPLTAAHVEPGEGAAFSARTRTELFVVTLSMVSAEAA